MNVTARILEIRNSDCSRTIQDIADELNVTRAYVSQVIAKKRKRGVVVPAGTSTSKGHVGKHTFRKTDT